MSRDFSTPQRTEAIDFVAGSYHGRAVYYWESAGLNLAVLHDPATRQCDIDVYVDPDLQGQGYGTRLLLAALELAQSLDALTLAAEIHTAAGYGLFASLFGNEWIDVSSIAELQTARVAHFSCPVDIAVQSISYRAAAGEDAGAQ